MRGTIVVVRGTIVGRSARFKKDPKSVCLWREREKRGGGSGAGREGGQIHS